MIAAGADTKERTSVSPKCLTPKNIDIQGRWTGHIPITEIKAKDICKFRSSLVADRVLATGKTEI
jgi:hypothetical protein